MCICANCHLQAISFSEGLNHVVIFAHVLSAQMDFDFQSKVDHFWLLKEKKAYCFCSTIKLYCFSSVADKLEDAEEWRCHGFISLLLP